MLWIFAISTASGWGLLPAASSAVGSARCGVTPRANACSASVTPRLTSACFGRKPLADSAIDRVMLVHALEMTNDPAALLREVWRVLASGGRLLAVVPNRRGLWARMDTTPFGHGRPYSRAQINQLLRETWFTPTVWSEALYVPPMDRGWFLRTAVAWERTGATLSAPFAGVHLVEAVKQVYRAIPARREKRRLVPALEPALAPSPGR